MTDALDRTFRSAVATFRGAPAQADPLATYAGALCGSLLTTRSTPRALLLAASRLDGRGVSEAAALCRRKAAEETGHDALVLADLAALGITEGLAEQAASAWARQIAWAHDDLAGGPHPAGVLGWMYALERFAALVTDDAIAAFQDLAPSGLDITRARRVHSGGGDDQDHVAELGAFAGSLSPDDARAAADAVALVVPLVIGAACDPSPVQRLADAGWCLPTILDQAA